MTAIDFAVYDNRLRSLEQEVAELRADLRRRRRAPHPDDLSDDAFNLHERLQALGPVLERSAVAMYSRRVVDHCLTERLAFRDPSQSVRTLTALKPLDAVHRRLADAVSDGPRTISELRNLPGVNKNALSEAVDIAVRDGLVRRGVIQTGRAGRPQRVIARADRPLPTHWDTHKVDWDRA